ARWHTLHYCTCNLRIFVSLCNFADGINGGVTTKEAIMTTANSTSNPNPTAARPPVQMLKLAMGYWVSQACAVAARLGIADRLAGGARASDELAREVGAHPHALDRLLRCCASVGVFAEQTGRRFALTPVGDTLRSG